MIPSAWCLENRLFGRQLCLMIYVSSILLAQYIEVILSWAVSFLREAGNSFIVFISFFDRQIVGLQPNKGAEVKDGLACLDIKFDAC